MKINETYNFERKEANGVTVSGVGDLVPEVYYEVLIQREVNNLREYAQTMEDELHKKSENDSMYHYDELIGNGKTRLLYIDKLDDYAKYTVHFPYMLRHSLITSIYSLLEERLLNTCNRSGILLEVGTVKDYLKEDKKRKKDTGIFLAQAYLKEYIAIDVTTYDSEWNTILGFNQLRNCIVHDRGNINKLSHSGKKDKREEIINAINSLGTDIVNVERGHIVFTEKACFKLLDCIEELFKQIYGRVLEIRNSNEFK
ncbi:hypothetical protein ACEPPU_23220 [Priestia aryabhattai]|uniref:hypothetical protein n=1 Tax=Priestia aryabhattai TaxID=412384 RepID=UPI0035ABBF45